jgi:DHA2 family multidrug resistance protein
MVIFFFYSFWGYKILTPDTGADNFFWMLMARGVGMGMLFIPITTLSLSTLKGQQIGQGAAFTGMMRQLGGSFGIALITTFMSKQNQVYRADLIQHYTADNPVYINKYNGLVQKFLSSGMPENQAAASALKMMDGAAMKQAAILSYMDVFLYLGVMFLICVPFVLMIKTNKGKKADLEAAAAAH